MSDGQAPHAVAAAGIAAQEGRTAPRAAGGAALQGARAAGGRASREGHEALAPRAGCRAGAWAHTRSGRGAGCRRLLALQRPRRLVRERRLTRERASVPCKRDG